MVDLVRLVRTLGIALFLAASLGCGLGSLVADQEATRLQREGLVLHNSGQYTEAADLFLEAARVEGVSSDLRVRNLRNAGNAFYEARNFERAARLYGKAADEAQEGTTFWYACRADQHVLQGDVPEAIALLERAAAALPPSHEIANPLGLLLIGGHGTEFADYERALVFNQQAYELGLHAATRP